MSPTGHISVREAVKGLRVPPYFIHSQEISNTSLALRTAGFKVFLADAADSDSEADLVRTIGAALPFPDYFGNNWDAFNDCLIDLKREGYGALALMITGCDRLALVNPYVFTRSVHLLLQASEGLERSTDALQFEVFFCGTSESWRPI